MIKDKIQVNLIDFLLNLSISLDFTKKGLLEHHKVVTLISLRLGKELGLDQENLYKLFKAAIIHDIGAITSAEKEGLSEFEVINSWIHCKKGSELLTGIRTFEPLRKIILCHHDNWEGKNYSGLAKDSIPIQSRIIYLADRIAALVNPRVFILEQRKYITNRIISQSGSWFDPDLVDIFNGLAAKEYLWFDIKSPWIDKLLAELIPFPNNYINSLDLLNLSELFARIVDSKSSFTYHHSASVSRLTSLLSSQMGWSGDKQLLLKSAALLHDIGKLAVPEDIIQKGGALTPLEYNIIKQHTYYTYWLLKPIFPRSQVSEWASYHHEKLNGNGYPFGKRTKELDLESRVIAIADIFTALREERPYRKGLNWQEIEKIMQQLVNNKEIDKDLTELLLSQKKAVDVLWENQQVENTALC